MKYLQSIEIQERNKEEILPGFTRDFPYLDRLGNARLLIGEIRSGKVQFPDRVPNSDSVLLREIQKLQREFLEEYHRTSERNFGK